MSVILKKIKLTQGLIVLLVCLFSFTSFSKESTTANTVKLEGQGLVYGKGHSFRVKAPKGWMLDMMAGKSAGLDLVFYPKGSSFEGSVIIYAIAAHKDRVGQKSFDEYTKTAFEDLKSKSPNLIFEVLNNFEIDGKRAQIRKFEGGRHGNVEAAAYIDEANITAVLIFSAGSEKEFQKWYPSFTEFINSYKYLADQVEIKEKKK